jgi:carbon-monoxide dehydrogenase medium subunit
MYDFDYHKPTNIDEAAKLLAESEEASIVAGGMTLLPTMKQRLAAPESLIDLSGIPDLVGVREAGGEIVVGAMTTHMAVATDPTVKKRIPALAHLADGIGDAQVRNRGTIGGSIANNDPAADYPAALVGLGATVETNTRKIPADDFFLGLFETALDEGELVTAVRFPIPETAGYQKFHNPASRYAIVGVFVSKRGDDVRVAVTGAGPCVFRVPEMETALASSWDPSAIADIRIAADELNEDLHASAEYRAHLTTVMAKRAVAGAH